MNLFARRLVVFFRMILAWSVLALMLSGAAAGVRVATATESSPPGLVVVIVVDGLTPDQLLRLRPRFQADGFARFFREGAVCLGAHYTHATTFTATGHATIFTGAHPNRHGLVANEWFDRATRASLYNTADPSHRWLETVTPEGAGTSPRNLAVTTIGDELRAGTGFRAKVFGISLKDRGAILPGGKTGTAYFFDPGSGRFVTSSYHRDDHPSWWRAWDRGRPQDRWFGQRWEPLGEAYLADLEPPFSVAKALRLGSVLGGALTEPGPSYYAALAASPFGDEYLGQFAEALVTGENLGRNPAGVPDLLAISFSAHDLISHGLGPSSREARENLLRLDRLLARLFPFLDRHVGADRLLVVLTSDHGFCECPEHVAGLLRLEAGRLDPAVLLDGLSRRLEKRFGPGAYLIGWWTPTVYLDREAIAGRGLDVGAVERVAAEFLCAQPGVEAVFTRGQLASGQLPATDLAARVARSWHPQRSGDLFLVAKPGWYIHKGPREGVAMHGSPWPWDTHVPLLFWGPKWIRPGMHAAAVAMVDVAPTLAAVLGSRLPAGSEGRVLHELLLP